MTDPNHLVFGPGKRAIGPPAMAIAFILMASAAFCEITTSPLEKMLGKGVITIFPEWDYKVVNYMVEITPGAATESAMRDLAESTCAYHDKKMTKFSFRRNRIGSFWVSGFKNPTFSFRCQ
jgi:hypothetical protein